MEEFRHWCTCGAEMSVRWQNKAGVAKCRSCNKIYPFTNAPLHFLRSLEPFERFCWMKGQLIFKKNDKIKYHKAKPGRDFKEINRRELMRWMERNEDLVENFQYEFMLREV